MSNTKPRSTSKKPLILIAMLPLLALVAAPVTRTHAAPRAAPAGGKAAAARMAELEVIDQEPGKGGSRTIRFSIALADDTRSSHVEADDGQTRYRVQISSRPADGGTATVDLVLRRTTHGAARGARPTGSTAFSLCSRVAPGRRVELGRIDRAAGGSLQVALTLR